MIPRPIPSLLRGIKRKAKARHGTGRKRKQRMRANLTRMVSRKVTGNYLSGLNDEQLQAVTHSKGYLRVIAGAGSDKTEMLVAR